MSVVPPSSPPHRPATPPGAEPVEWIRFGCPRCGKKNKIANKYAGTVVRCARCQGTMTAPSLEPAKPAEPSLHDLSSHVAARGDDAKRRKSWPWWLIVAHLSIPVLTVVALWYLRETGHLPWVDPYLQQLKGWVDKLK